MDTKTLPRTAWNKGKSLVKCICLGCGKDFEIQQFRITQGRGKYCSSVCYKPRKIILQKVCEICKNQFETKRGDARFCSSICFGLSNAEKIKINCLECKSEFEVIRSKVENLNRRFCSRQCARTFTHNQKLKTVTKNCIGCGKEMTYDVYVETSGRIDKYCSKPCYFEFNKERIIAGANKAAKDNAHIISQKAIKRHAEIGHPMLGKHQSEETRRNISKQHIESGCVSGENNGMFGKNHSKESREKMSETRSKKWVNGEYNGIFQRGYIFSTKMNSDVYYRSSWEKEFISYLDKNEDIKQFLHDSIRIPYYDAKNHKRNYIVDFLVTKNNGDKELIEIKPSCFTEKDINKRKFAAARKYCEDQGIKFRVLTEKYLLHLGLDIKC